MDNKELDNALQRSNQDILQNIVNATDSNEVKDLTHLFNINVVKKNALRVAELNELVDKITQSIEQRINKRPDEFSNKDLIDYLNALNNSLEKAQKTTQLVDEQPAITYNQQNNNNQVNINITDDLSRESRERISEVIDKILKNVDFNISADVLLNKELIQEEPTDAINSQKQ